MKIEEMFYIKEDDWYKLQAWATIAYDKDKNEISGLMTAVPQEDGRYKLSDVEILKQQNSGTNTELDGDCVTEYTMRHGMKYNNPNMKFVWWHSHHTMEAFWSGTDIKEINAWENSSFSLALVINLKEEYKFRVSIWNAAGLPIEKHYDTTLTIEREVPKIHITDAMEKSYEALCENEQVHNQGITWYRNGMGYQHSQHQQMLFGERELKVENDYIKALEKAEQMQDMVVDGSMKIKDYKQKVKAFNKVCKDSKLPFKLKIIDGNKMQITNQLMQEMPSDLFEWSDENAKEKAEAQAWNMNYGGYNVGY
tara:strand:- start:727 stop:1653 length:927 start_codon:yes stop_codon:yes gene_type:complete